MHFPTRAFCMSIALLALFLQPLSLEAFAKHHQDVSLVLAVLVGGFKSFCWTLAVDTGKDEVNKKEWA